MALSGSINCNATLELCGGYAWIPLRASGSGRGLGSRIEGLGDLGKGFRLSGSTHRLSGSRCRSLGFRALYNCKYSTLG